MIKRFVLPLLLCLIMLASLGLSGCGKRGNSGDDVPVDIDTKTAEDGGSQKTDPTGEPTPEPTEDVLYTTAPTELPELPEGQVLWLNTMPTDLYGVSMDDAEAWFSDAVFVGDSITLGWKNYNDMWLTVQGSENFFGQTHFLCEGSYGAGHALESTEQYNGHPTYMGEQHNIWDAVKLMGAKKVFICFGLNDLAIYGIDGTVNNFSALCDKISEVNPGVKIYIISAMYMYKGSYQDDWKLSNPNLRELNNGLRNLCKEKGCMFVDIASHLVDSDGYLLPQYCSDEYVHQTVEAYNIWADILRSIAAHEIVWGY